MLVAVSQIKFHDIFYNNINNPYLCILHIYANSSKLLLPTRKLHDMIENNNHFCRISVLIQYSLQNLKQLARVANSLVENFIFFHFNFIKMFLLTHSDELSNHANLIEMIVK